MCFYWLDDLPCAACKDFVVFVIHFLSTRTNRNAVRRRGIAFLTVIPDRPALLNRNIWAGEVFQTAILRRVFYANSWPIRIRLVRGSERGQNKEYQRNDH
jgi:hypothetical protein